MNMDIAVFLSARWDEIEAEAPNVQARPRKGPRGFLGGGMS